MKSHADMHYKDKVLGHTSGSFNGVEDEHVDAHARALVAVVAKLQVQCRFKR